MTRKQGTNSEVCQAWVKGEEYPCRNSTDSLYHTGDTIYSYGSHFPMGHKRKDGLYILNGDRYSVTTSQHQSALRWAFANTDRRFTTSFGMLRLAGLDPQTVEIVDYEDDRMITFRGRDNAPIWATQITALWCEEDTPENERPFQAHSSATVIMKKDDTYYICGQDESSYFISVLPHQVNSVGMAFMALKPKQVVQFEKTAGEVKRQGEWFFCDVTDYMDTSKARNGLKTIYNKMKGNVVLPREDSNSNPHKADRGCARTDMMWNEYASQKFDGDFFSSGIVCAGRVTHPEHSTLRLCTKDEPRFFLAFRNTAIESWSSGAFGIGVD